MNAKIVRFKKLSEKMLNQLSLRHFDAFYCETKIEAKQKILNLIGNDDVVSWGGSKTMEELGIFEEVKKTHKTIDRKDAKTPDERKNVMRRALLCDTFLMSTNAISEDGILVNIDGNGNRLAALLYGPRQVIVACGANKITANVADAISRARTIAAPINANRFSIATPCTATGSCGNCKSAQSICSQIVITRLCKPAGRIKVVLVGEELGF